MKENVELVQAGDLVESNMLQYSAYVLLHRAIPDLRDGLKPVYRRILFTMHSEKITRFSKSANVTGKVMLVHPHGDSYGTVVGMAQKDKHMNPFIESKGNFGSYLTNGISPAAARYTEVRLGEYALNMLEDIPKKSVPMIDNYDATIKMPEVMPTRFPTILEFTQSGIGVGFSSSTLGMNTTEIADALIKYLKTGEHTILIPDFPSAGSIINEPEQFERINKTGRGTVRLRSNYEIDGLTITITQIPYGSKRDKIVKKISDLAKTEKLKEIAEIKDLTGIKGQKIVVRAKRGTNMKVLMEKLYKNTDLENTLSANMNIITNQLPKVLSVEKVIEEWIEWRRSVIIEEYKNEKSKVQSSLNRMYALKKILDHVDELIEIIRKTSDSEIENVICSRFGVEPEQSSYIANMKLRSISRENIQIQINKIDNLEKELVSIQKMIDDKKSQDEKMISDFESHKKKFGKPRCSHLIDLEDIPVVESEKKQVATKVLEEKDVVVSVTRDGYVFVQDSEDENITLKPGDEVVNIFKSKNNYSINLISRDNYIYSHKIDSLKESSEDPRGNYLGVTDIIMSYIPETLEGSILLALPEGRVVMIDKEAYNVTGRKKTKNAFNESLPPIKMLNVKPGQVSVIELENGKQYFEPYERYSVKASRTSQGVRVSKTKEIKDIYIKES